MAGLKSIEDAQQTLSDALLDITTIVQMVDDLAGDDGAPAWVYVVRERVRQVDDAGQAYMRAVSEHAHPVLRDVAAVTRRA